MSRTDKDAPWWVRAEFYEPVHANCENQPLHVSRWSRREVTRDCDLPEVPVRHNWQQVPRRIRFLGCTWEPNGWDRKYYTKPPRPYDRRIYFHGPNRREIRDFCSKALQEFRGCGDVEAIEPGGDRICQLDWWD